MVRYGNVTDAPRPARRWVWALLGLTLGFSLSVACGHGWTPIWFALACVCAAGVVLCPRRLASACLWAAWMLVCAGWTGARIVDHVGDSLCGLGQEGRGAIVRVRGTVLSEPEPTSRSGSLADFAPIGDSATWDVRVRECDAGRGWQAQRGRVRVFLSGAGTPEGMVGREMVVTGRFEPPSRRRNPGEDAHGLWAAQQRQLGSISVPDASLIEVSGGARSTWGAVLALRASAQRRCLGVVARMAGDDERTFAFLSAILLGVDREGADELRASFARVGVAHVLAISGFHLAILAWVGLIAVRLTGDRGWLEPTLVALIVLACVMLVPARAPILRAAAMVIALLLGEALGRRHDRLALLGWAAVGVGLVRPMDLTTLGYQLSFGLVAGMLWLGPALHERLFGLRLRDPARTLDPTPAQLAGEWFKGGLSTTVLCWVVSAPTLALRIGAIPLLAVPVTIVIVPLAVLVLALGYAALVVGAIAPAAGGALGALVSPVVGAILWVVARGDTLALASLHVPVVSWVWALGATAWIVVLIRAPSWRSVRAWGGGALLIAWVLVGPAHSGGLAGGVAARLDTLDVGDGTCHLLRAGNDAVLIDCGSRSPAVGLRTIPRAARALGAWRVPTLVLTHPDLDHYIGVLDFVGPLGVRELLVGPAFARELERSPNGAWAHAHQQLADRGVRVREIRAGESIPLGPGVIEVLHPGPGPLMDADNDAALVLRLGVPTRGGERSILLTSDIGPEAIGRLAPELAPFGADVMELPHHGSCNTPAVALVAAANPGVVVQSTGPSREHNTCWDGVRDGRDWLVTSRDGAVFVEIVSDGTLRHGSSVHQ